jgi:hypothetical protein
VGLTPALVQTFPFYVFVNPRTHVPRWKYPRRKTLFVNIVLNKLAVNLDKLVETPPGDFDFDAARSFPGVIANLRSGAFSEGIANLFESFRTLTNENLLGVG